MCMEGAAGYAQMQTEGQGEVDHTAACASTAVAGSGTAWRSWPPRKQVQQICTAQQKAGAKQDFTGKSK